MNPFEQPSEPKERHWRYLMKIEEGIKITHMINQATGRLERVVFEDLATQIKSTLELDGNGVTKEIFQEFPDGHTLWYDEKHLSQAFREDPLAAVRQAVESGRWKNVSTENVPFPSGKPVQLDGSEDNKGH
ncbi:MAG: hypothetical protein AAB691_00415 [Patescibacteria group bacterium]